MGEYKGRKNKGMFFFLISLVIGLYFLNLFFNFFNLPDSELVTKIDRWLFLIGGILIVFGGISFFRSSRRRERYRR